VKRFRRLVKTVTLRQSAEAGASAPSDQTFGKMEAAKMQAAKVGRLKMAEEFSGTRDGNSF
jgi:hypothetical protein